MPIMSIFALSELLAPGVSLVAQVARSPRMSARMTFPPVSGRAYQSPGQVLLIDTADNAEVALVTAVAGAVLTFSVTGLGAATANSSP
jgi:hypothetical protein